MPTYEYRCRECGHELEAVQSFADEALTTCPECGGALRKKFGAPGIAFKGSGFYKTDSRSKGSSGVPKTAESPKGDSKGEGSSSAGSSSKSSTPSTSTSSSSSSASSGDKVK